MSSYKIMIIDDSEADQFLAKIIIEDYDSSIELVQVYDGKEALATLEDMEQKPDLIYLDINMPVMDGHEFLSEYSTKGIDSSVIIMLTSSEQEQDKTRALVYDFVKDYFVKPLDEDLLEQSLELAAQCDSTI